MSPTDNLDAAPLPAGRRSSSGGLSHSDGREVVAWVRRTATAGYCERARSGNSTTAPEQGREPVTLLCGQWRGGVHDTLDVVGKTSGLEAPRGADQLGIVARARTDSAPTLAR